MGDLILGVLAGQIDSLRQLEIISLSIAKAYLS